MMNAPNGEFSKYERFVKIHTCLPKTNLRYKSALFVFFRYVWREGSGILLEGAERAVSIFLAVRPQRESAASRFCIPFCRNSNAKICCWNRWDGLVFYPSRMMFFSQAWIFHDRLACWFGRYDRPKHNCSSWSKNRTPLRRGARARNHTESIRKKHAFKKWTWFLKSPCSTDFAWSLACKPNIQNISPTWEFSFDFIELHVFSIFLDMSFPGCVRSCKTK